MALSVVNHVKITSNTGTTAVGSFGFTTTAGNLIVAAIASYNGQSGGIACSDTTNGSYTFVDSTFAYTGSGSNQFDSTGILYFKNCGASNPTVTGTVGAASGSTFGLTLFIAEVAGADTSAPFTTGEHGENASSVAATTDSTASLTNSVANSIFFAVLAEENPANPNTITINATGTVGTWTETDHELDGAAFEPGSLVYQVVASSASRKHVWTASSSQYSTCIACFKQATVASAKLFLPSQLNGIGAGGPFFNSPLG